MFIEKSPLIGYSEYFPSISIFSAKIENKLEEGMGEQNSGRLAGTSRNIKRPFAAQYHNVNEHNESVRATSQYSQSHGQRRPSQTWNKGKRSVLMMDMRDMVSAEPPLRSRVGHSLPKSPFSSQ